MFLRQPLLLSTHPPPSPPNPPRVRNSAFKSPNLISPSSSSSSTHLQTVAVARPHTNSEVLSWLFTPPQILSHSNRSSGLPNPLQCCCAQWRRVTVASWHTTSAPGGFRHTHHHIQVPSQHVKEVELGVSFNDRCPLLPNGVCCFYSLCLYPLLSSKVQSALKAWPTDSLSSWLFPSPSISDYLFAHFLNLPSEVVIYPSLAWHYPSCLFYLGSYDRGWDSYW